MFPSLGLTFSQCPYPRRGAPGLLCLWESTGVGGAPPALRFWDSLLLPPTALSPDHGVDRLPGPQRSPGEHLSRPSPHAEARSLGTPELWRALVLPVQEPEGWHIPSGRKDHACQRVRRAAGSRGCVCVMRGFGLAFPESCSLGPWSFPTPVTLGLQGVPVGGRRAQLLAVRRHSHFQQPSREGMVRDCVFGLGGAPGAQGQDPPSAGICCLLLGQNLEVPLRCAEKPQRRGGPRVRTPPLLEPAEGPACITRDPSLACSWGLGPCGDRTLCSLEHSGHQRIVVIHLCLWHPVLGPSTVCTSALAVGAVHEGPASVTTLPSRVLPRGVATWGSRPLPPSVLRGTVCLHAPDSPHPGPDKPTCSQKAPWVPRLQRAGGWLRPHVESRIWPPPGRAPFSSAPHPCSPPPWPLGTAQLLTRIVTRRCGHLTRFWLELAWSRPGGPPAALQTSLKTTCCYGSSPSRTPGQRGQAQPLSLSGLPGPVPAPWCPSRRRGSMLDRHLVRSLEKLRGFPSRPTSSTV